MKYLWRFAADLNCSPREFDQLTRAETAGGIGFLLGMEQRTQ